MDMKIQRVLLLALAISTLFGNLAALPTDTFYIGTVFVKNHCIQFDGKTCSDAPIRHYSCANKYEQTFKLIPEGNHFYIVNSLKQRYGLTAKSGLSVISLSEIDFNNKDKSLWTITESPLTMNQASLPDSQRKYLITNKFWSQSLDTWGGNQNEGGYIGIYGSHYQEVQQFYFISLDVIQFK